MNNHGEVQGLIRTGVPEGIDGPNVQIMFVDVPPRNTLSRPEISHG